MIDITHRPSLIPASGMSGIVRPTPRSLLSRLAALLRVYQERALQRRELRMLDERSLKDIGLSRAEVAYECSKPFWRA